MIPTQLTGLKSAVRGEVLFGEMMSLHTSYAVGGNADAFVTPEDIDDVMSVYDYASRMHVPVMVIGGGTNLLVGDLGIRGIVLHLGKGLGNIKWEGDFAFAEGGTILSNVVSEAVKRNLSGLEYCTGIPGSLGGAVAMNAGTSAKYISRSVSEVGYVMQTGERMILSHEQMHFDYRSSVVLRSGGLIEWVKLRLKPAEAETLNNDVAKIKDYRQKTQPWGFPNAGCVFRNPPASFAGQLIEEAGFKGKREGGIEVSNIHANFLVNVGNATPVDVLNMMERIFNMIYDKYNIYLKPEVRIVGDWSIKLPGWAWSLS